MRSCANHGHGASAASECSFVGGGVDAARESADHGVAGSADGVTHLARVPQAIRGGLA
jgi:hypothetical protein